MVPHRRKHTRLPPDIYRKEGAVIFTTLGTSPRSAVFSDHTLGHRCVDLLRDLRDRRGNAVYAYCLMPDHAHLVIESSPTSDLSSFLGAWKSLCHRERTKTGRSGRFWQRGFWDRVVRNETQLVDVVHYVLENPVRAGLVDRWQDYPLCGSLEWTL